MKTFEAREIASTQEYLNIGLSFATRVGPADRKVAGCIKSGDQSEPKDRERSHDVTRASEDRSVSCASRAAMFC